MIYLVTANQELFENDSYKVISVDDSLSLMQNWKVVQFDTETTSTEARIGSLLTMQFGNKKANAQIVIDCSTINPVLYKDILEGKFLIGHNLKFDLQWLYNYGIVSRHVYDTMIVEQLLYLGYPSGVKRYSLQAVAQERLGIYIDKTVRGEIIWRGLDTSTILYSAGDVKYLEDIMHSQIDECKKKNCLLGAQLECETVPAMAYLEWCGIKLDENKWKQKMISDHKGLEEAKHALDDFLINNENFKEYVFVNKQGDLFSGFDLTPKCTVNWSSSQQVVKIAKKLGFNTTVQDKKTGADKDSVLEKQLKTQKGINDEFLKLYFNYQEKAKVCSTYGQGHLDAINPKTGRIHTIFRQLGASSGRMSCGSSSPNEPLAKLKHISPKDVNYPNLQQLPADEPTRSSFVAEKGNLLVSCDYSAMEGRLAADIYNDSAMIEDFLHGTKDSHSLFAWMVFRKECEQCGCQTVFDVKKKAPQWRKAVKAVEFAYLFGAAAPTISQSANCTVKQAQQYIDSLNKGFSGLNKFVSNGSRFVRKNGYVLMNKYTGHKMYWWDHDVWLQRQQSYTKEFWEDYRQHHKGTGDSIAMEVREHFQSAGKWDRMARNAPTQGTGACITKTACTNLFNWIIENNYFDKVKIVCVVHDEIVCEFPESLKDSFPKTLENIMETAANKYCKSVPIPACAEVSDHWVH